MEELNLTQDNIYNFFKFAKDFGLITESQYYKALSTDFSEYLKEIADLQE